MLISFSIENWMSFKDKVTMSMIASQQTTFGDRLARTKNKLRVLPLAAIYGGNASGKSKDQKIDASPFALCKENRESPCNFWFVMLAENENMYEYSFSVDNKQVHKEKLIKIRSSTEEVLFERVLNEFPVIGNDERLRLTSENTRKNQLFLTNTIEQNQDIYEDVYSWFRERLKIITPISTFEFESMLPLSDPWFQNYVEKLKYLDTGISRVEEELVDNTIVPASREGRYWVEVMSKEKFVRHDEGGKEVYKKLVTYHKCHDGEEVQFELRQESDGTIRLMDILPAFISSKDGAKEIIIIDEIDRSLHHVLIRRLLEHYLQSCDSKTRKQVMFTTHDLLLMDQELMRRDEMFLVERDSNGESCIKSINDFKGLRIDKDVRKSYLLGRFGGIPKL